MRLLISFLVLLAVILTVAAAAKWAFWPSRDLPVNRVRHTRIRLRLRLHPGRGFASAFECWLRWGRLASFRGSRRARPSLSWWHRLTHPAEHSVLAGRAHYGLRLRVPVQEAITITAPPRAGKTGMLADLVLRFCGPVVATSVKSDIYELTSGIRAQRGPIAVFNPQHVSDLPSTFAWSPVAGCRDPEVAARRAEAFTGAISVKGTEQEDFWAQQASEFFRAALMAADLAGGDMRLVGRWLMGTAEDAEAVLERAGQIQWATSLAQLRSPAERTISTIRLLHNKALSFLGNPALAASVLPQQGNAFDIEAFLAACGTLYLIAEAQTEEAPVAPLMACFLNEVHYTAKLAGSRMPGRRLDPCLLMALDEIANIAPINIPNFMADSGGRGIQLAIVRPGSVLVAVATGLLFVLGVGLFAVSLDAQYRYVFHAKHQIAASWVEALALDVGMAIFSLLALGLARAPAPAVLTPAREFTLATADAPAATRADGNGHRYAPGFPWGGEDQ